MPTILTAWHPNGPLLGTCGAECYAAIGKRCRCICQGFNHGVGETKALFNARKFFPLLQNNLRNQHPKAILRNPNCREYRELLASHRTR